MQRTHSSGFHNDAIMKVMYVQYKPCTQPASVAVECPREFPEAWVGGTWRGPVGDQRGQYRLIYSDYFCIFHGHSSQALPEPEPENGDTYNDKGDKTRATSPPTRRARQLASPAHRLARRRLAATGPPTSGTGGPVTWCGAVRLRRDFHHRCLPSQCMQ